MSAATSTPAKHDRQRQLVAMLLAVLSVSVPAAIALGLGLLGAGGAPSWGAAFVAGVALGTVWYRRDRYPIPLIVIPIASAFAPLLILAFVAAPAILLSGTMPRLTLQMAMSSATISSPSVVAIEQVRVETELAAWVICDGTSAACAEAFTRGPLAGVLRAAVASDDVKGGGAIDDAIAKHSLGKQEQIVVLSIDSNPTLEAVVPILVAGLGMLGLNFLVLLVTHVRARLRRRPG